MRLEKVSPPDFWFACKGCNKTVSSRDAYADLDGKPFTDFYCENCALGASAAPKADNDNDGVLEITRCGLACMQVCVPSTWSNEQITEEANRVNPTGIDSQWQIITNGPDPERVQCAKHKNKVHVLMQC